MKATNNLTLLHYAAICNSLRRALDLSHRASTYLEQQLTPAERQFAEAALNLGVVLGQDTLTQLGKFQNTTPRPVLLALDADITAIEAQYGLEIEHPYMDVHGADCAD